MGKFSAFLFGMPSALEGFGRIFDFGGSLNTYNLSENGAEADLRAMYADWAAVGEDMRAAMEAFADEVAAEQAKIDRVHEESLSAR